MKLLRSTAVPVPPTAPTPQAQTRAAQRRARRLGTYEQVWSLHRQGWSLRLIAQHLGIGRMTVVQYLGGGHQWNSYGKLSIECCIQIYVV
jgi:hypothetical protein